MEDEPRRESIGKIADGVRSVEVDVADIDVESCGVVVVVANDVDEVHVLSEFEVSMEELAGFDVSDIDRYFDVIRLPRDVLMEEYLFNEVLGAHANLLQDAHVILALHFHEYLLPPVLVLDKPRFHGLAA